VSIDRQPDKEKLKKEKQIDSEKVDVVSFWANQWQ
jgi:hypothetical protein